MGYLESGDHHSDPNGTKHPLLGLADGSRDAHQVSDEFVVCVEPVVDLCPRDHQRVAGSQRGNGEKRDTMVVLPYESCRDVAVDDPREQRCHGTNANESSVAWL